MRGSAGFYGHNIILICLTILPFRNRGYKQIAVQRK
jgi:hypothetical protein